MSTAKKVIEDFRDLIMRRDNPHEVTAGQVGTYTKEEVDALIGGGGGGGEVTNNTNFLMSGINYDTWEPIYVSGGYLNDTIIPNARSMSVVEETDNSVSVLYNSHSGLTSGVAWLTYIKDSKGTYQPSRSINRYRPQQIESLVQGSRLWRVGNSSNGAIWGKLLLNNEGETAYFIGVTGNSNSPVRHHGVILNNLPSDFTLDAHAFLIGDKVYLMEVDFNGDIYIGYVLLSDILSNKSGVELTTEEWSSTGISSKHYNESYIKYADNMYIMHTTGVGSIIVDLSLTSFDPLGQLVCITTDEATNHVRMLLQVAGRAITSKNVAVIVQANHLFEIDLTNNKSTLIGNSYLPNMVAASSNNNSVTQTDEQSALTTLYGAVNGNSAGKAIMLTNGAIFRVQIPYGELGNWDFIGKTYTDPISPYDYIHPDKFVKTVGSYGIIERGSGGQLIGQRVSSAWRGGIVLAGQQKDTNDIAWVNYSWSDLKNANIDWIPGVEVGSEIGIEPAGVTSISILDKSITLFNSSTGRVTYSAGGYMRDYDGQSPFGYIIVDRRPVADSTGYYEYSSGGTYALYDNTATFIKEYLTNKGIDMDGFYRNQSAIWIPPKKAVGVSNYPNIAIMTFYNDTKGLNYLCYVKVDVTLVVSTKTSFIKAITPDSMITYTLVNGSSTRSIYTGTNYVYEHFNGSDIDYTGIMVSNFFGISDPRGNLVHSLELTINSDGSMLEPKLYSYYNNYTQWLRYFIMDYHGPCVVDTSEMGDNGGTMLYFHKRKVATADEYHSGAYETERYLLSCGMPSSDTVSVGNYLKIGRVNQALFDGNVLDYYKSSSDHDTYDVISVGPEKTEIYCSVIIPNKSWAYAATSISNIKPPNFSMGYVNCNHGFPTDVNLVNRLLIK